MEPAPGPARRPFNPEALQPHLAQKKLRAPVVLPQTRRKTVSLPRDSFAPVIQAEVGREVSVNVYSSKVLVPIAQIHRETATSFRRLTIATQNEHASFEVYAAPIQESDDYFRTLRKEL
jgi:hypothetical protein